jgi:hypothetical protein
MVFEEFKIRDPLFAKLGAEKGSGIRPGFSIDSKYTVTQKLLSEKSIDGRLAANYRGIPSLCRSH